MLACVLPVPRLSLHYGILYCRRHLEQKKACARAKDLLETNVIGLVSRGMGLPQIGYEEYSY